MTATEWWMTAGAVVVGIILTITLSSIPERFVEWRRRIWESDSDGNLD